MRRSPLRKVSKKQEKRLREYQELKQSILHVNTSCEIPDCLNRAYQVHHTKGRSGDNLCNTATWILVCQTCHTWIHENMKEARKKGYVKF